jgi:hypothetical protein
MGELVEDWFVGHGREGAPGSCLADFVHECRDGRRENSCPSTSSVAPPPSPFPPLSLSLLSLSLLLLSLSLASSL